MSNIPSSTTAVQPEEVVQQLRAMREQIPDFVQLPRPSEASLRRVANLDPVFIQTTINAIGASESLRSALGRTAEELRQDVEFTARWGAVADELKAMLVGVNSALTVRRHRIGLTVLQGYSMSRQLVRQKEHAHLLPHVDAMRRRFKFGRKRAKAAQPEAAPATARPASAEPQAKSGSSV